MPISSRRALILVLVLGSLYWALDAVYLYTSFQAGEVVIPGEQGPSLLGVLYTDVPRHVLAGRFTFLLVMVATALVALAMYRRQAGREASLLHQLESAGDLFSRHDLAGRFLYASSGFERVLGVSPHQMRGKRRAPGWVVLNRAELTVMLRRLAASKDPVVVTTRMRHADGREIWLESVGRRVDNAGRAEVVVVSRDVSARHRAEAALATSEQRLRLITETMQEVLWLRVGGRLEYVNSAVERVLGLERRQFETEGLAAMLAGVHEDDRERVRRAMEQATDHHEPFDEEFRLCRADGQIRWLHAHTVHVETSPEGQPMAVGVATDITSRWRAEDALRTTVARYRTLYDAAHVGITITDLGGAVVYANPAAAELYGAQSVADLLGHTRRHDGVRGFFQDPVERDDFLGAMRQDPRGRQSRIIAMQRMDGRAVSMRVSCGLMDNPVSGRQEILAILEDVTERRRAEHELRRSEERYRRLVEFLPDGVLMHDGQQVLLANPACARLFGRDVAELPGTALGSLAPTAAVFSPDPRTDGVTDSGEVWLVRDDGTRFPATVTTQPVSDGGGGRIISVVKDLSNLRRADDEIAAQQAILSALIETMPLGIVAKDLDRDLCYVVWNRYMEEELGLSKAEVLGRQDHEIFAEDFAREMRRQDRLVADHGEPADLGELNLPWRGATLDLRVVKVPVRDADGRISRVFTIVENVTRQKQLQSSLQQARRMEAIGRLAAAVAHDFNNVLQVVQGHTESVEQGLREAGAPTDEARLVLEAVERARELVQRLLNYSRYDSIKPEPVDINHLAETVAAMGRGFMPEAMSVRLQTGELPTIYADRRQLEQALLNLLANARDALPGEGEVVLRTALVDLGAEFCSTRPWARPGSYVQITVRDQGCGIPPAAREHVYEPFYTTKGFGQGTGLGLATVYAVCKRHKGYVDFESELDVGTSFHLFLPVALATTESPRPEPHAAAIPHGSGELVMVVDDDDMVRSLTRQMLEKAGYAVLDARDGEDAMEIFMAHATEIAGLVIDVVMPRMDGRMLYDNISELRPGVPVLFCSSYSADLLESEYMLRVGGALLSKPYRAADLLTRVRRLVDRGAAEA